MESKLILVTGGAGFVGTKLCERLIQLGHRVISLDNYFTGSTSNHLAGVSYREGHTRDISALISETPDLVFHLGEYSRVEKSFEDPIELIWDLNIAGTFSVLEFCRRKKSKLIYAGSSTKFADGGEGRGQSPYAWSKSSNTELVSNYGKWFGLNFVISYFYNVYGKGEISTGPYATVIGIFKELYLRGLPITVVSPGTQVRCFTHVSDIVDGLMRVAEHGNGDSYDIGNERAYSILDLAKMFTDDIIMLPERQGNRIQSAVTPTKLYELGWKPQVTLEQHIAEFKQSVAQNTATEKRVLIFSTTFHPIEGPAERALVKLMQALPSVHFDVITTFTQKGGDTSFALPNVSIHRLGKGDRLDKYRLIFSGVKKARELAKAHTYIFTWSIMASYAALAGVFFRRESSTPLLITLADQRIDRIRPWVRSIFRFILKNADQISSSTIEQERGISRIDPKISLTQNNRTGDAFANQVRFLYNNCLKQG